MISSFQLLFDVGVFVKEKFVFEFEVFSSAKSNSQLIEFISKLGVVSLKSSDLSDVEVKIIGSDGFRYNPFLDLGLDLVLVSWRRRHFNNKIIATVYPIQILDLFLSQVNVSIS